MATMKQVAQRAGVSISTVSHVINNTRVVSDDVRQRVLGIIDEMRYMPSAVARSLKNDKTNTIGVLVPNSFNPYFAELIRWIEDAAFELGYTSSCATRTAAPEADGIPAAVDSWKSASTGWCSSRAAPTTSRMYCCATKPCRSSSSSGPCRGSMPAWCQAGQEEGGLAGDAPPDRAGPPGIACVSPRPTCRAAAKGSAGSCARWREAGLDGRADARAARGIHERGRPCGLHAPAGRPQRRPSGRVRHERPDGDRRPVRRGRRPGCGCRRIVGGGLRRIAGAVTRCRR